MGGKGRGVIPSLDKLKRTWLANGEALVKNPRYLRAKARLTCSCTSNLVDSDSLPSEEVVWRRVMFPAPISPLAENLTSSLEALMTTETNN